MNKSSINPVKLLIAIYSVAISAISLSLAIAPFAYAATNISSCTTISSPGVYVLNTSIINSSATGCINITASNVIFDGNGYAIDGNDTFDTYGVYVYNSTATLTNVTVKNLIVTDWDYGIYYRNIQNGSIWNNTVGSNNYGIFLNSSSSFNTVANNTVTSNSIQGILLNYADNNNIINNNAISNTGTGIRLLSSSNNTIANNTAGNNNQHGIYLSSSSSNIVANNNASNNGYDGIVLQSSSNNNTIANNTASNNANYGIYLSSYSNYNTIANNTVSSNSGYGIYLNDYSEYNTLSNNTLTSNSVGIRLRYSGSNTLTGNTIVGSSSYGIYTYKSGGVVISDNTVDSGSSGISITHQFSSSSCPTTISGNNVSGNSGNGISAGCRNVVIENNIVISNGGNGIYGSSASITAINNTVISNSQDGIFAGGGGSIINNTVTSNNRGIVIGSGGSATIRGNIVMSNGYGVYLSQGSSRTVVNNTISSNTNDGIYVYFSSSNTVANNTLTQNNKGVYFTGSSTKYNNLSGNNITSSLYGIYFDSGVSYNRIWHNNISDNTYGFYLWQTYRNTIYDNYISNPNNAWFLRSYGNYWSIDKTPGTSIVGGPYLGGNYWASYPPGSGFSDTCTDNNGDWLCDSSYTASSGNIDYYPLTITTTPDTTPPSVSIIYPLNTTYHGNVTLIRVNITDNWEFLNATLAEVDGSNITLSLNGSYYINDTINLGDGAHSIRIYANDSSGNMNSTEIVYFTVDYKPVTECMVISSPGYYPLLNDILDSSAATCINITAGNVTLDGMGKTIDGVGTAGTKGVYVHSTSPSATISIENLTLTDWGYGAYLNASTNVTIRAANITSNSYGIYLDSTGNSTIKSNYITANNINGIYLYSSNNNTFYDNYLNNTNNTGVASSVSNTWNTKQAGTNILGGSWIVGNYWTTPAGNGFSETCDDWDANGVCDRNYTLASGNVDNLPLTNTTAVALSPADVGRYNVSFPVSSMEVESRITTSCGNQSLWCHLRDTDWTNNGLTAADALNGAYHPSSNRSPPGFYPDWIHNHHGGTNWPQWKHTAYEYGFGMLTEPVYGSRYSGKGDAQIGSGNDIAIGRNLYQVGFSSYPYEIRSSMGQWYGNPSATRDRPFITCSYGNQGSYDPLNGGCHGTYSTDFTGNNWPRTDTIKCTQCHSNLTLQSTNNKHGVVAGAQCADCHYNSTSVANRSAPKLGEDASIVPQIKYCTNCHQNTKIGPGVVPEFAHAGKDCRYCHGWGMNVTREYSWNITCGNNDSFCHASNAPPNRAIGGGSNFAHGSSTRNATCGNCHLNSSTAHKPVIPRCRKCHNESGIGNASVGSSSRYGITGDNRNYTIPNWDSGNNIYHDGSRGNVAGLNCTFCHAPNYSGTDYAKAVHYINTSQNNGRNYVPDCRSTRCHGNSTTPPSGEGTWIKYSHGEAVINENNYGKKLTCVDCHNNYTLRFIDKDGNYTRTIDTVIHTTANSGYNITPFNASRLNPGTNNGEVNYTVCLLCHNTSQYQSAGDCSECHNGSNGYLEIHDDDMGVGNLVNLDGDMLGTCTACHGSGLVPAAYINVSVFNMTGEFLNNNPAKKSYNRTLHGDINQDGVSDYKDCKVCHYNTTGMGSGYKARLYNGTGSGVDPNNVSQANTYYCTVCHYDNRTITGDELSNGNVTDVGNPPKITMHAGPNLGIGIVRTASGRITRTIFSPGRAPACEICHNNSVVWRNHSTDSMLKAVAHYGRYTNLTTIGTNDNNTKACAECHRGDSSTDIDERATWGIGTNRSEGYVGPGGDIDMGSSNPSSKFYCWSCHVAANFGLTYAQLPGNAPPNFHNKNITIFDFSWQSCNACHA